MANHKSALKRMRQNVKRRARNRAIKSRVRTAIKKARMSINEGRPDSENLIRIAERELAKAATKGVFKKTTSSRLTSRLWQSFRKRSGAQN